MSVDPCSMLEMLDYKIPKDWPMSTPTLVLRPRNQSVADLIERYLAKHITYAELLQRVAAMGFKTTSVYEMVLAAEAERPAALAKVDAP